ncbi:hypothetical protein LZ31DRAFT_344058 [Colletotrichum somersetense]|nr:hypothetical protein LZ31DRAFT_344058 [Colletotrichum somersetense]
MSLPRRLPRGHWKKGRPAPLRTTPRGPVPRPHSKKKKNPKKTRDIRSRGRVHAHSSRPGGLHHLTCTRTKTVTTA